MYNPFEYDDPRAVNKIVMNSDITDFIKEGLSEVTEALASAVIEKLKEKKQCIVALDGYISAPFSVLSCQLGRALAQINLPVSYASSNTLYCTEAELTKKLAKNLPADRATDPPLLYGKLFDGNYEDLFDAKIVKDFKNQLSIFKKEGTGALIISGNGSLSDLIRPCVDIAVFLDVTQKRTVLNIKQAKTGNLGFTTPKPYKPTLRQAYYIDFEVASSLRGTLIKEHALDFYVCADSEQQMQLLPFCTYLALCEELVSYPFRCRPVYLEGVWGGFYVKHLRNLPQSMKNCAWVFDLIPLEVSIVLQTNNLSLEFPFYGFVQTVGDQLMGSVCVEKFGGYFPIRFNYDDTFHASGNMSIQCHPDSSYIKHHNNELGRQDESYYIVVAGQDAKTYCGFTQDEDVETFIDLCRESEKTGQMIDYERYIHAEQSKPGMQFLIPGGTIHASGRNQVILEIGSLTVGSYTYKMYDYVRKDLDGNRRPIHTFHGNAVLKRERKRDWVRKNLIQDPCLVRETNEGKEILVGEHDLLYFSLRNLVFDNRFTDETIDRFHVLVLVEGEKIMVRSSLNPKKYFIQEYLDMIVVPASFGPYELINLGVGKIIIHKTQLRDGYEHIEL